MRRFYAALTLAGLLACGLTLTMPARAAEPAAVGTWKVVLHGQNANDTVFLIKIIQEENKSLRGTVIARGVPEIKEAAVASVTQKQSRLQIEMTVNGAKRTIVANLTQDAAPAKLYGFLHQGTVTRPLTFERTTLTELDPVKSRERTKEHEALFLALQTENVEKQGQMLKEILAKHADHPAAFYGAIGLASQYAQFGAAEGDARMPAEKALAFAARHGREVELQIATLFAELYVDHEKLAGLAAEYGRRAERLLTADDSPQTQYDTLKVLATALRAAKKVDEAKAVEERLGKLETALDDEYLKTVPPFKTEAYRGRTAKSDRVVVVELFTGAQCPPCVAADVAFDGAIKTYKPTDVVFIQHHLHIPGPDPLTVPISVDRSEKYYGIQGTPALFVNGSAELPLGGLMQHSEDRYAKLRKAVEEKLETAAAGKLTLKAERKGDMVEVQAEVADLANTGEDVRLRFFLVEENIRYVGTNGIRFHHNVVRAMPGGLEGFALKDKTAKQSASVNLADLRKQISDYLNDFAKNRSFPNDTRPLALDGLKVIAVIQNDKTKEILQAAQVDVAK
jgi:hypothetical protein